MINTPLRALSTPASSSFFTVINFVHHRSQRQCKHAHNNASCRNQHRVHERCPIWRQFCTIASQNHGSASCFSKRSEQICTHACNVPHIVTDIVRNCGWISHIVLLQTCIQFASQICPNICSFGVDATTNTSKQ